MKIQELNLSEEDDLSIFDSEDQHHNHLKKSKFPVSNQNQFEFQNLRQVPTTTKTPIRKPQKKRINNNNQIKERQGSMMPQKRGPKKSKYEQQQQSSDEYQVMHDESFKHQKGNSKGNNKGGSKSSNEDSFDNFSAEDQSFSIGNTQKYHRKRSRGNRQAKNKLNQQKQQQQNLISGQQFKILDNGSTNQFNFKYNLSSHFNLNQLANQNKPMGMNQDLMTSNITKGAQGFNHPYLYTNSKNPYQGVYQADSDAQYFQEDESPYEYFNTATVNYQRQSQIQGQKNYRQRNYHQKVKVQEQVFQNNKTDNYIHNHQEDQKSSSSLKQFEEPNKNQNLDSNINKNIPRSDGLKKRGRPRKNPLDPNVKIEPKQLNKPNKNQQFRQQREQNQDFGSNIKHEIKYQPGYRRKRSAPPPLSYYEIDLIKLLPIFTQNPQIFDSKIPPDIDFTLQTDKQSSMTDDQQQNKKSTLQFQQVHLTQRKQYQRDMAIVFSTLGFGIAIAKQYFGPSITFTQYNYLLKTIILNSFRKLQYMLFAQKVRIRRLSNSYFILVKSYLTDFKNSLGQQRSDTFKKIIRIAYKFSSTEKYPVRDQLISLYEQIFRLARQRITNSDNPVRRKIVQRADFWSEQFEREACQIYLSCRHQWKNLTLIRSQLLHRHPQISETSLTQLLLRLKFRQLFRRLIGQVVKRRFKLSREHPDLVQLHQVPKVRKIDDNKIRILIHGVSGQEARIGMLQMYLDTQNKIQLLIEAVLQMNKVRISGAKYDEMTQKDQIQFQEYMPKRGRKRKQLYPQVKRQYGAEQLLSDELNIEQQDNYDAV